MTIVLHARSHSRFVEISATLEGRNFIERIKAPVIGLEKSKNPNPIRIGSSNIICHEQIHPFFHE